VFFKEGGSEECLFLGETELFTGVSAAMELLVEIQDNFLGLLNSVFISGKSERQLGLHPAAIETVIVLKKTGAGMTNEVKAVAVCIFLDSVAFNELSFLERFEVPPELLLKYLRTIPQHFEATEPRTANLRVVLPKHNVFRRAFAIEVREVEIEMFVERDTNRLKVLDASKI
jgi:hypothetical protein